MRPHSYNRARILFAEYMYVHRTNCVWMDVCECAVQHMQRNIFFRLMNNEKCCLCVHVAWIAAALMTNCATETIILGKHSLSFQQFARNCCCSAFVCDVDCCLQFSIVRNARRKGCHITNTEYYFSNKMYAHLLTAVMVLLSGHMFCRFLSIHWRLCSVVVRTIDNEHIYSSRIWNALRTEGSNFIDVS